MRRFEVGLGLLILGGLVLVWLVTTILPAGGTSSWRSGTSVTPEGRRAAYLLLSELGFDARTWSEAPGDLRGDGALLILPQVPELPEGSALSAPVPGPEPGAAPADPGRDTEPGRDAETRPARSRRRRDPLHYLRFAEQGGTVLAQATEDMLDFLVEDLGLLIADEVGWVEAGDSPAEVRTVVLPSRESLGLHWTPEATLSRPDTYSRLEPYALQATGEVLALRLPVGDGGFLLLAPGGDPFSNEALRLEDNALFLVRLAEDFSPSRRVLFDEYALGGWEPPSPLALAFGPAVFGFSLHVLAWGALALWMVVRPRPFPRDPVPLAPVSAMIRAEGFASVLVRERRWSVLGAMLGAGAARRLAPRGQRTAGRSAGLKSARRGIEPPDPAEELAALLPSLDPAIREALEPAVQGISDEVELERLGERLLALEQGSNANVPPGVVGSRRARALGRP